EPVARLARRDREFELELAVLVAKRLRARAGRGERGRDPCEQRDHVGRVGFAGSAPQVGDVAPHLQRGIDDDLRLRERAAERGLHARAQAPRLVGEPRPVADRERAVDEKDRGREDGGGLEPAHPLVVVPAARTRIRQEVGKLDSPRVDLLRKPLAGEGDRYVQRLAPAPDVRRLGGSRDPYLHRAQRAAPPPPPRPRAPERERRAAGRARGRRRGPRTTAPPPPPATPTPPPLPVHTTVQASAAAGTSALSTIARSGASPFVASSLHTSASHWRSSTATSRSTSSSSAP